MKFKKVFAGVLAAVSVVSMSVSAMASGSITDAVDTNNVSAETTVQTTPAAEAGTTAGDRLVADIEVETVTVGASLTKEVANLYEEVIQTIVNALNAAQAETTVKDAFLTIFAEEELPKIHLHKLDKTIQEDINLSEYKFISPMMDLDFEEAVEATEENPVDVTFTANNMTDRIQVDVLHYCEKHEWEVLEGEKVSENQIKASFHSASPVALIYKELPEEETEVDTDVVAP